MVGFCSSARFIEHDTGLHHPERPDRIRAICKAVRDANLITSADPFPEFKLDLGQRPLGISPLIEIELLPADEKCLLAVHPLKHLQHVRHIAKLGGVLDQGDTPCGPRSFATALLSAGAALQCCDAVMTGKVQRAFSAARPPGHHAEPDRAMGFCLFNNVAIAARYIQQKYDVERVAIVDFDVHHGNGTQAVFEADPSVLFISLHQHPATCYPGTGHEWEVGIDKGQGFTMNLTFQPSADDDDYLQKVDERVVPALDEFKPQVLLISAGFDGHRDDPLAKINLSEEGFELMTRKLVAVADQHCNGRIVSVLEGGYNLQALGRCVVRHLTGLHVR